jgi:hypothetical protein
VTRDQFRNDRRAFREGRDRLHPRR